LVIQKSFQVRFKMIVKVSYSNSTFIYIKTAPIKGSIFHLASKFVRSASSVFLSHQLPQIIITIGPIHSKPNYPGWLQQFPSKNYIPCRIAFSLTARVLLLRSAKVQILVQFFEVLINNSLFKATYNETEMEYPYYLKFDRTWNWSRHKEANNEGKMWQYSFNTIE
jgi:hypothetical protein